MDEDNVPARPRASQAVKPDRAPLFALGQVVATPAALASLEKYRVTPATLLNRHQSGDWGDLAAEDRSANDTALKDGGRLLSAYYLINGDRILVITKAVGEDGVRHGSTCLLLPSEY